MLRKAEKVMGPAAPTRGEEADEGSPDAVSETEGNGLAKKYARHVKEEEDPSVIERRCSRSESLIWDRQDTMGVPWRPGASFVVATGKEGAEGLLDLRYAVGRPGGKNGDPAGIDRAYLLIHRLIPNNMGKYLRI